jgi:DNA-binding MarR family transcriptional regulator
MIRKSNYTRSELLRRIGHEVQAFQDATDEVDEAAAGVLHVNRTDLRCLSVIARGGASTASELATAAGLTRGAMTTALDRIEAAGYARRVWDGGDRRTVRVALTDLARKEIASLYGPLASEGAKVVRKYTTAELTAVLRYLEEGRELQRAQAARIRQHAKGKKR